MLKFFLNFSVSVSGLSFISQSNRVGGKSSRIFTLCYCSFASGNRGPTTRVGETSTCYSVYALGISIHATGLSTRTLGARAYSSSLWVKSASMSKVTGSFRAATLCVSESASSNSFLALCMSTKSKCMCSYTFCVSSVASTVRVTLYVGCIANC